MRTPGSLGPVLRRGGRLDTGPFSPLDERWLLLLKGGQEMETLEFLVMVDGDVERPELVAAFEDRV